jgi:hypothetical protein
MEKRLERLESTSIGFKRRRWWHGRSDF